ncbi:MAG: chloride channel protein [Phycisphaeraceae bacterium]|nr:chloride channel protein [Phycisphaeraceae bacterium]
MPPDAPQRPLRMSARLAARLGVGREWTILAMAVLIGLLMSGVAMAFIMPLHWLAEQGSALEPAHLWWVIPVFPIAGALLAGTIQHLIPAPGVGSGVSRVLHAIHRERARLPLSFGIRKWAAATCTIGSGGSAGAEGPIATIGAVIGSRTGQIIGANTKGVATLLGCGAAAGIASVFNAPIAGVFFVMEIMLRDFSLRTFTPIVVSAVISATVTQGVLGSQALFARGQDFSVGAFSWYEIPNYLGLGVICGVFAALFVRSLMIVSAFFRRLRLPSVLRPAAGATVLAILGILHLALSPGEAGVPGFYGNGYEVTRNLLNPDFYFAWSGGKYALRPVEFLVTGIILLALLKVVATCLTIGSGGAGGLFAPSLLLGAAVGGACGWIVTQFALAPAASPAHYALVGMAAMVAATSHAPMTGIFLVYEVTRSYEIILPLMFAAVISTIIARLVYRESAYTAPLAAAGIRLGGMSDFTVLRRITVSDVPLLPPVFVRQTDSAARLLELSERLGVHDFVVIDARNRYLGLVTSGDLRQTLVYREAVPLLQVAELLRDDLPTVTPEDTLDIVMERFAGHEVETLAVVHDQAGGEVIGLVTRGRLMRRYQAELEGDSE